MTNVLLILDGFAFEYLEDSAFDNIADSFQLIKPMKPTAGWGSKLALYTGNSPKTTNSFTQYWLAESSQFKWLKTKRRIWLPPMLSAVCGGFFRKVFHYRILPNTRMPLNALQYFDVSTGYLDGINIKRPINTSEGNLEIVYTKEIDEAGHRYGAHSPETKMSLEKAVELIESLLKDEILENLFVTGDHGMCDVEREIDITSVLDSTKLVFGRDFLYFIDSTMVRFWFLTNGSEDVVKSALRELKGVGKTLSKKDMKDMEIDFDHNKYGDLIYWLNRGNVFEPSFYHRWMFSGSRKNKAMHGYMSDQTIFAIASREEFQFKKVNEAKMTSFYPTMMNIIGKEYDCEGRSLLR